MTRIKILNCGSSLILILAMFAGASNVFSQSKQNMAVLSGTVKDKDGKPLDGVGVSARGTGKTFVTTVYTDESGTFRLPALESGEYNVWAQAKGFERVSKEDELGASSTKSNIEFVLPRMEDFQKQLSGNEWVASLPGDSPSDLRMKAILMSNCTGCHTAGYVLQNRFDANGWRAVIHVMEKIRSIGIVYPNVEPDEPMSAYESELATYLERVRGPESSSFTPKPFARPTGDAARVVITEYDLPRPDMGPMAHDGSDWSEGTPSRWAGRAAHDVVIDKSGFVWFADDSTPERTIGRLDPRTGEVKDFKLADPANAAESSHAMALDKDGKVWFANGTDGAPTEFDPRTDKFRQFPRPSEIPFSGDFITVDSEGNAWAPTQRGAFKLNAHTGEYTNYAGDFPGKANYDITIDKEGNAWVSQPGGNNMLIVNAKTGKVEELALGFRNDIPVTEKDRENADLKLTANTSSPVEKGPRRNAADKNGDYVWVCEFFANKLARINIYTREIKEYALPHAYSQPYGITVDAHHMVWITMLDSDRIAKFDPTTEKFTEYQLPTLGTEIRHIQVDDSTNPGTVWVPYNRVRKIARIQFLTNDATARGAE